MQQKTLYLRVVSLLKSKEEKTKIYGGGWAGICLAHHYNARNIKPVIYSKELSGGLMYSKEVSPNNFVDCHGSHILFSKDSEVMKELVAFIENPINITRNAVIGNKFGFIKYPFENGMLEQSKEQRDIFYQSIEHAERIENPVNLKEVFLSLFGDEACKQYFYPYNEKVWKTPIDKLSPSIGNRIPRPSAEYMDKLKSGIFEDGYMHQSKYVAPKNGIVDLYWGLRRKTKISSIYYDIDRINFNKEAISTIPLDYLGNELGINTSSLQKTGISCNIIKTNEKIPYSWIYDYGSKYPFNRVFSPICDEPIIVFEETVKNGEPKTTEKDMRDWLQEYFNGKITIDNVYDKTWNDYAYPIPTVESDKALPNIRAAMPCKIFGRFGSWNYWNMDTTYIEAKKFVEGLKWA